MNAQQCSCATGVGQSRCQHDFSANEVRSIRGEWFTNEDPVTNVINMLKNMPENLTKVQPREKLRAQAILRGEEEESYMRREAHIHYYLRRVCRLFFQKCLGISKKKVK